jgi:hypothetical protein
MLDNDLIIRNFSKRLENEKETIEKLKKKYGVESEIIWIANKPPMSLNLILQIEPKDLPIEIRDFYSSTFAEVVKESA